MIEKEKSPAQINKEQVAKLNSLEIDIEKGLFRVNNIDISNVYEFDLNFKDGIIQLSISHRFFADGKIL